MKFLCRVAFVFMHLFLCVPLKCSFSQLFKKIDFVHIKSGLQSIRSDHSFEFQDDVYVFLDNRLLIKADNVVVDEHQKLLTASSLDENFVVVESDALTVVTKNFFFDLQKKTGFANDVRIHLQEGFLKAKRLENSFDDPWHAYDITYTPCDTDPSHWSIRARHAWLYNNYLIRASNILFFLKNMPLFSLPYLVIPLQKRSQSGFLMPKISYDQELGLGIKQEFYFKLAPRCDMTHAVAWRDKKGVIFSQEFRWARNDQSATLLTAQYAKEWNAFVRNEEQILQGTNERYWIEGDTFDHYSIGGHTIYTSARADFGTDKNIDFHFYGSTQKIEDYFYNVLTVRLPTSQGLIGLYCTKEKILRDNFLGLRYEQRRMLQKIAGDLDSKESFNEREDRFVVKKLPRISWYRPWFYIAHNMCYSHYLFFDYISSNHRIRELTYANSLLVSKHDFIPLTKGDTARFFYRSTLEKRMDIGHQRVRLGLTPEFQLRSNVRKKDLIGEKYGAEGRIFSRGAYRISAQGFAELIAPEYVISDSKSSGLALLQPGMRWEFVPSFFQKHWYHADRWDRVYPKNEIVGLMQGKWYVGSADIQVSCEQPYEFYRNDEIFPLRRSSKRDHLLPLRFYIDYTDDIVHIACSQEIEWYRAEIPHLEIHTECFFKGTGFSIGVLYQNQRIQKKREVLSDIPLFLHLGIMLPLGKQTTLHYDGQFFAREASWKSVRHGIRPLLHRAYLEYKGHCWNFLFGYETKHYRQEGNWRTESAFVLSFGLDTLGSFSSRMKRPSWDMEW